MGARLIFHCLLELARCGQAALPACSSPPLPARWHCNETPGALPGCDALSLQAMRSVRRPLQSPRGPWRRARQACARALAATGSRCAWQRRYKGIVEDAIMMGTPVVIVPERYVLARSVVAGRFVNAFCTTDWTLSLNFRARSVRGRRQEGARLSISRSLRLRAGAPAPCPSALRGPHTVHPCLLNHRAQPARPAFLHLWGLPTSRMLCCRVL